MKRQNQANKYFILDERPIESLSMEERYAKFARDIGSDADALDDDRYRMIREAYGLPNDRITA